jgi:hypothetical protein
VRSDVPAELDGIAMQALASDPDDRFADARRFERALAGAMEAAGLRAAASDLEAWLREAMPPCELETPPTPGELLSFETAPTPGGGTQPLAGPVSSPAVAPSAAPRSFRRLGLLGLIAGLVAAGAILLFSGGPPGGDPVADAGPRSPAIGPAAPDAGPGSDPGPADEPDAGRDAGGAVDAGQTGDAARAADRRRIVRPQPRGEGTLVLNSDPWARILVDGRDTGVTTPTVEGLRLPAGRRRITLVNPGLELTYSFTVEVRKDEVVKRFIDLRKEGVQR